MEFKPGFRLSTIDIVIITVAILSSAYFYTVAKPISYIIAFVVGHFFLFCNISRMSRLPELVWAVVFIVVSILALRFDLLSLFDAFLLSLGLTVLLLILEFRKPSYHGIFWQSLNPNLQTWFAKNKLK